MPVLCRRWQTWFRSYGKLELHGCGVARETSIAKGGANINDPGIGGVRTGTFVGDATPVRRPVAVTCTLPYNHLPS
jgi:hypothetical protein